MVGLVAPLEADAAVALGKLKLGAGAELVAAEVELGLVVLMLEADAAAVLVAEPFCPSPAKRLDAGADVAAAEVEGAKVEFVLVRDPNRPEAGALVPAEAEVDDALLSAAGVVDGKEKLGLDVGVEDVLVPRPLNMEGPDCSDLDAASGDLAPNRFAALGPSLPSACCETC